jgi:hypothetical protein
MNARYTLSGLILASALILGAAAPVTAYASPAGAYYRHVTGYYQGGVYPGFIYQRPGVSIQFGYPAYGAPGDYHRPFHHYRRFAPGFHPYGGFYAPGYYHRPYRGYYPRCW